MAGFSGPDELSIRSHDNFRAGAKTHSRHPQHSRGLPATVYFADARQPYPAWMRLLKPGFRHCGLIIALGPDMALVMESSFAGLAIVPVPVDGVEAALDLGGAKHSLQSRLVHPLVLRRKPRRSPALFTCVELVKRAIGVADASVLTPWQLYRHLGGSHA